MRKHLALGMLIALFASTPAFPAGKVAEVHIGKGVTDRKITEETTAFAPGDRAFIWMKVEGAAGETLTVTWQINGQSYPATLNIGGDPWRTWASKTLHIAGEWTVTVTDSSGATLHEAKIEVK
ncbi:MAG TPA: DUF2914 domain-containing protein [Burkholderiales bacterium]|nr:DUF2914 domain-containing protein [Burkholderiales bacterium]